MDTPKQTKRPRPTTTLQAETLWHTQRNSRHSSARGDSPDVSPSATSILMVAINKLTQSQPRKRLHTPEKI